MPWSLLAIAVAAAPPLDPADLLDDPDPWVRAWAEGAEQRRQTSDASRSPGLDALLRRRDRSGLGAPRRRDAVVLHVQAGLRWRARSGASWSRFATLALRVRWEDLLRPPPVAQRRPGRWRRRWERRCQALYPRPRRGGRSALGGLRARARAERRRALGCRDPLVGSASRSR